MNFCGSLVDAVVKIVRLLSFTKLLCNTHLCVIIDYDPLNGRFSLVARQLVTSDLCCFCSCLVSSDLFYLVLGGNIKPDEYLAHALLLFVCFGIP